MRIIGGEYRGKKLAFPKSADIRPTQDRVREALFNVIAPYIRDARVLDLFAGSGSLGIEGISRGAKDVTFVDNDPRCTGIISKNVKDVDIEGKSRILRMDALRAINLLAHEGEPFDIVFLDPPYYHDFPKKILIKLGQCDILAQNNIIVVEHSKKDKIPVKIESIIPYNQKRYGNTMLTFCRKNIEKEDTLI